MRRIVKEIPDVERYYDDVLVASTTWEEHLPSLTKLFERIQAAGLMVCPIKCEFALKEIEGHRVGGGRLKSLGKIFDEIEMAPRPKTKKQVRVFLGLTGYYTDFIPGYAEISTSLTELTKKGEKNVVKWNDTHEEALLHQTVSSLSQGFSRSPGENP